MTSQREKGEIDDGSASSYAPIIRNTTNKKLSEEESRKIYQLSRTYEGILDELGQLEVQQSQIFEQRIDYIRLLARTLERLYLTSDLPEQIDTISTTIIRSIQARKYAISDDLVWYALDSKYKRGSKAKVTRQQAIKSTLEAAIDNYIKDLQQQIQVANLGSVNGSSALDEMDNEPLRIHLETLGKKIKDLRKLLRIANDHLSTGKVIAESRGLALDPEAVEENRNVVSSISLKSGVSKFSQSLRELAIWIDNAADKVEKYAPLTDEQAELFAKAIEIEIELWKPLCDEKFRLEPCEWILTAANEAAAGKHAAAERHKYLLPKKTIKELTALGEDVAKIALDPNGFPHLEMDTRALVREQVGDVKEPLHRFSANLVLVYPARAAMHTHFISHQGWSIAKRAYDARDKLSRAA